MKVICPTVQAPGAATNQHDGQSAHGMHPFQHGKVFKVEQMITEISSGRRGPLLTINPGTQQSLFDAPFSTPAAR
ncbi:MAG: hypothetical protein WA418_32295 [Bradyrhizobium sp.]